MKEWVISIGESLEGRWDPGSLQSDGDSCRLIDETGVIPGRGDSLVRRRQRVRPHLPQLFGSITDDADAADLGKDQQANQKVGVFRAVLHSQRGGDHAEGLRVESIRP